MMADRETFNTVNDVYERLGMDARNNPIDGDSRNVKCKRALEKARSHVNAAIENGRVTAAELARRTGIKASAISAFRKKRWQGSAGTLATTASELSKAINVLLRQREADRTNIWQFIKTGWPGRFLTL